MPTVVTVVDQLVDPFELGVACEVFGVDRSADGGAALTHRVVAPEPGPQRTVRGFDILVHDGLDRAVGADVIVIPAFDGYQERAPHPAVLELLRRAHADGAWILTLCIGAFVAGEAGLLDGRRAVTHWMHVADLERRFPNARVEPDALYVEDDRVVSSAGVAGAIDASLHLLRRICGAQAAAVAARRMVVPPQRDGGQAQYATGPVVTGAATSLSGLTDWMLSTLDEDHTITALADRAALSPRTLQRRFREELGATPVSWLTSQRLRRAQELLEATGDSVEQVARSCGFGSAALMRHHFQQAFGTTPTRYRRRFTHDCPVP